MEKDKKSDSNDVKCQLKVLYDSTSNLNCFDKIKIFSRRLRSALFRRLEKLKKNMSKIISIKKEIYKNNVETINNIEKHSKIQEGDWVEIRSIEEIMRILDDKGRTQGLDFIGTMKKYCGMRKKVMKKVDYIFDERKWEMRKCKNVVILEGVICDGKGMFSNERCDRCCYFFWKTAWLKKINK